MEKTHIFSEDVFKFAQSSSQFWKLWETCLNWDKEMLIIMQIFMKIILIIFALILFHSLSLGEILSTFQNLNKYRLLYNIFIYNTASFPKLNISPEE